LQLLGSLTGNGLPSGEKWKYELGNCRENSDTLALNNTDLEASQ